MNSKKNQKSNQKNKTVRGSHVKLPLSFQNILEDEEVSLYEEYFNSESTKKVREKLVEYLESKVQASYFKTDKEAKYEMPSWAEYQADAIGARRSMLEIIKFLKKV